VGRICDQDGGWLVTTHNRRLVKAQKILGEEEVDADGEKESSPVAGASLASGFGTVKYPPTQAVILEGMLSENAQWLVTVMHGQIMAAALIEKPQAGQQAEEPSPAPSVKQAEEPAPAPAASTRKPRTRKGKVDQLEEVVAPSP